MSSFTDECWDAMTVSGYLTRGGIPGVAEGYSGDINTVLDLWQRGENFVAAALRQSGNLGLAQNYGDAGMYDAMARFDRKYSVPGASGLFVWQDPSTLNSSTGKRNDWAKQAILRAKVDSLGHAARAAQLAKQQYGRGVGDLLDNACICFAKGLTIGSHTPKEVFSVLRDSYPDVCKYYDESKIEEARSKPAPAFQASSALSSGGGGCYVATAVYGSYDCPEVWTLRRYRDNHLAESTHGRLFIKAYYAVSPTLVRLFGDKRWFQSACRSRLDRFVCKLHEEGYSSMPYNDKEW